MFALWFLVAWISLYLIFSILARIRNIPKRVADGEMDSIDQFIVTVGGCLTWGPAVFPVITALGVMILLTALKSPPEKVMSLVGLLLAWLFCGYQLTSKEERI